MPRLGQHTSATRTGPGGSATTRTVTRPDGTQVWLDQAFIISNSAMEYDDLKTAASGSSRHTDVKAVRYRTFVGSNPDKTTYFQPVLDRLQVIPSRLDALQPAVLVEGKGDYLILCHGLKGAGCKRDYAVIPTRGADHFDELIGILLGWGVNFALCCDDDGPGRKAVSDYRDNWGFSSNQAFTLADVDRSLKGQAIEGVLEPDDLALIAKNFGQTKKPTKSQVQLFFSEDLAKGAATRFSDSFYDHVRAFDAKVRMSLSVPPDCSAGTRHKGKA